MIRQGVSQSERLQTLRELAVEQLQSIIGKKSVNEIKKIANK